MAGLRAERTFASDFVIKVELHLSEHFQVLADRLFVEFDSDDVLAGCRRAAGQTLLRRDAEKVVREDNLAALDEQRITSETRALSENHSLALTRELNFREGFERGPKRACGRGFGHFGCPRIIDKSSACRRRRVEFHFVNQLYPDVDEWKHIVFLGFRQPKGLKLLELFRILAGQVLCLRAVLFDLEELPLVLVEMSLVSRRRRMQGRGLPALVPDAACADHFVVLRLLGGWSGGVVEAVTHGDAR